MKQIDTFQLKDGREVKIVLPEIQAAQALTDFINRLSREDTFLSFSGEKYSLEFEKEWLKNVLQEIRWRKNYLLWAMYEDKIIGNVDIKRGGNRDKHVGTVGLMVDRGFRGLGLGKYLLEKIIELAKGQDYKILSLTCFADNDVALALYHRLGFKEYGRLPQGLYRKNKYSDKIEMYLNL